MKLIKPLTVILGSLVLLGCANGLQQASQSSKDLQPGDDVYTQSQDAAKVKTKIVTEYVPVPVPGQLMPMPNQVNPSAGEPGSKKFLSKEEAVKYANTHAVQAPTSNDFFNAMMTYNYMPGAMYMVYAAPMKITDIVLQKGEKIVSTAAGDTLRWQLSQTYSGDGVSLQQHILVKPNAPGLENTVVITTNRRVYHLLFKSDETTYMMSVNWRYPHGMVAYAENNGPEQEAQKSAAADESSGIQLDLSKLNFNYRFGLIEGPRPPWHPVRVFNDGRQTFIEFPETFSSETTPMLFVANNNGQYGTMVNWRLKGKYMVVDAIVRKARLQTGVDSTKKTIVQIEYTGNP